jgi:2-oxoglutarate ferredoxin oxidoreductase subunit alpha
MKEKKNKEYLLQGNEACVEGALYAGCNFFGGYPITPSTEIAELLAQKLPKRGGVFIQMEDEIAGLAVVLGASVAGAKAMTATSGPGFSLMQEHIGYAYMTEIPAVIVNVMRGGPSTGLPTLPSQSDFMQARYGIHGDYYPIVLVPASVPESFSFTVRAFNLAETFLTPVVILLDEIIGHMREKIVIPPDPPIEVVSRQMPKVPPEWFYPYELTPSGISPRPPFGRGYRYNITGLTHDISGYPTSVPKEIREKLDKLKRKIMNKADEISRYDTEFTEDARELIVAVGSVSRVCRFVVRELRKKRKKIGLFRPQTLWPFPEKPARELFRRMRRIFVVELNQGQIIREVERFAKSSVPVFGINKYDGELITPEEIIDAIREAEK